MSLAEPWWAIPLGSVPRKLKLGLLTNSPLV
jgi:hypothetical protein